MKQVNVTIPYAPRRAFLPYHNRTRRWAAIVAHRRAGKTVGCINDIVKRALIERKDEGRYAYICPLLGQAKDAAWTYLQHYTAPLCDVPPSQAELYVTLRNRARVRLYGADNPDRLRGGYFDGVILDEYADMFPGVWGNVIRPALSDRRGWATFIGTPKGRNSFFDIYSRSVEDPEWFSVMLKASQTGILPADELASARRDMTAEQYEQEYECSFDAAIIGAYFGKEMAQAEREGRIRSRIEVDRSLPIHTAWDLGKGPNMAVWVWQMVHDEIRVLDFLQCAETEMYAIPEYIGDLEAKGYSGGIDYVPHDATVPSLDTNRTRVETFLALGRKPRVVTRTKHKIDDSINAARITLPRVYFDGTLCKVGIEALKQYVAGYDEKNKTFLDEPKKNWAAHGADAFQCLCMAWREAVGKDQPKTEAERNADNQRLVARLIKPRTIAEALVDDEGDEE